MIIIQINNFKKLFILKNLIIHNNKNYIKFNYTCYTLIIILDLICCILKIFQKHKLI